MNQGSHNRGPCRTMTKNRRHGQAAPAKALEVSPIYNQKGEAVRSHSAKEQGGHTEAPCPGKQHVDLDPGDPRMADPSRETGHRAGKGEVDLLPQLVEQGSVRQPGP